MDKMAGETTCQSAGFGGRSPNLPRWRSQFAGSEVGTVNPIHVRQPAQATFEANTEKRREGFPEE